MQAISVDRFNAFGVNSVGLHRSPFPLSIGVVESEGIWTVGATAARTCDVIDVLAGSAHDTAMVLNVGQTSWLTDDHTPWPLGRIAQEQNVDATVHDIGWAAPSPDLDGDLLVMAWRDLYQLLDGWSPYGIDILDIPGPLPEVDELVLAINTRDAATCMLPRSPGSGIYYSGHDDCYLHAETIDATLPTRLLTRLLTLFAGSALLGDDTDTLTVPQPEQRLAATLLHHGSHWVGTILNSQPGRTVTLALTPTAKAWRLADPVPVEPSHRITLDLPASTWRVSAS